MTTIGAGGLIITALVPGKRYVREYRKLTAEMQSRVDEKLEDLLKNPRPSGLAFEKLKSYANPSIYTIHITGNYKLSFEIIEGSLAFLRRVAPHGEIDRAP